MSPILEFGRGLRDVHAWALLAWNDVRGRYRRTVLGPLWLTLSHGIFIGGLALAYSSIFDRPLNAYFVYLAAGITVWQYIVGSINTAPLIFMRSHNFLVSFNIPASVYIFRFVAGDLITFAHHMIIYVIAIIIVPGVVNWNTLWAIPGMAVLICAGAGWSTILSFLGARFRDLGPAVASVTHMLFFFTPIFWERSAVAGGRGELMVLLNPFYHLLEVVRAPLLGQQPEPTTWLIAGAIALVLMLTGLALYAMKRASLTYWL
jgi:ABC-type polysaccharide/polyol phosphate export permease